VSNGATISFADVASKKLGRTFAFTHNKYFIWAVRGVILVVAVVFIIVGVKNGNMAKILIKAINICLECVGIG
jgi:hypothetical protein